jgi:hypothetical protein
MDYAFLNWLGVFPEEFEIDLSKLH